jgi:L-arabinose isomerase
VTEFLEKWCEAGPTHHFALGVGNRLEEIRNFARMMDIDLTVVE